MALDFFESLFDIDGDGEITAADDILDFMILNEIMNEDEDNDITDTFERME